MSKGNKNTSRTLVEATIRKGQPYTNVIKPKIPSLYRIELDTWKHAWLAAKNRVYPNRMMLYEVYDNISIDNTLTSIIDTRILKAQQSKFMILDKDGKPDVECTKLFERPWFHDYIKYFMVSKFESFSLIEIYDFKDNGEIAKCNLVDKYHVKPELGIVSVEAFEMVGYDYTSGPLSLYYIPVGDINDLGLLYKVAPHILAKKYALGTWAEYNEKIGIPFRSVHSNSTDKVRQKQLGEIMEQMGSAGWAVLTEQEKVELHEAKGSDPTKCFEGLINKLDAEAAMLILGQSSTSNSQNNKGTYGSMQILQGISDDRHESDLVSLKYHLNDVLIPRLMQYSPIYKKLQDKYFVWDKSVDLSIKETVEYVAQLATLYDISPEFITQKTGIPVTAKTIVKPPMPQPALPKKKAVASKKKTIGNKLNTWYSGCCSDHVVPKVKAGGFDAIVRKVAKRIFDGKQAGVIDVELLKATAKELMDALNAGYKTPDTGLTETDTEMIKSLKENIYVFSGFKTYQQLKDATELLVDEGGKVRSKSDYVKQVLKRSQDYNVTYLNAEYDNALTSSSMASQWIQIQSDKDTLPLLKFDAVNDSHTTATCKALDGLIARADDPIWDTYYLPLHWGERSVIQQLASGKLTDQSQLVLPDIAPMFSGNVGKDGVIFPDTHPYFDGVSGKDSKNITKEALKIMNKEDDNG